MIGITLPHCLLIDREADDMERTDFGKILEIASFAGKILMESGGEIYRVEHTVRHICRVFHDGRCECVATPTAIMISVIGSDGEVHSVIRRITNRKVNLQKIEQINDFSRNLKDGNSIYRPLIAELSRINDLPPYPKWLMTLMAALGAAALSIVFGGGLWEFFGGMMAGGSIHAFEHLLAKRSNGSFFINLLLGGGCALLGWLFSVGGIRSDWWIIMMSAIMQFVPGMLMTNALRDLAAGDYLSGVSRSAEAFCIASALAVGAAFVFFAMTELGGRI